MALPAVSVLLPVHNAEPWLEVCLRSLLSQRFDDFEIVAVDDGSRDRSGAILDAWARRERRLRALHQPHAGLIPSLNSGLAACKGDLVARMDADDVAASARLGLQARRFAQDPQLDVCSCLVRHFPFRRVAAGFKLYDRWLNSLVSHQAIMRARFIESPLAHPSVMIRRATLVSAGGYRDRGWPEDYDLWLRLAASGARFAKVPRVLHYWRDHDHRLTRRDPRYGNRRFLALKAHYLARGPLAGDRSVLLWGAGQTGRRLARELETEGVTIDAFLDIDCKKIGGQLRGRPVVDAEELPALGRSSKTLVLVAVAARGARSLIRDRLERWRLVEGRDFILAA